MKIAKSTRQRIESIKAEASTPRQHLVVLMARLDEHAGTKRIARKLERVIRQLEEWQRVA